jgi:hypothetical protein
MHSSPDQELSGGYQIDGKAHHPDGIHRPEIFCIICKEFIP